MADKISVTRALNELKLLDKRISKATSKAVFVGFEINGKQQASEFKPLENLQSVEDMIARRASIKSAIMKSNAETVVTIGGVKMTVVQAIETKDSIEYKKNLLKVLESQHREVLHRIAATNEEVEERLDALLKANFGKESKTKDSETDAISKPFLARNQAVLTDPINIAKKAEALSDEIDSFENEVDFVLSESNALTTIEV